MGGEGGVLDLSDSLFVGPFFKHLLFSVARYKARMLVGGSVWIEDTNVEKINVLSKQPPQKPFAAMSRRAPS